MHRVQTDCGIINPVIFFSKSFGGYDGVVWQLQIGRHQPTQKHSAKRCDLSKVFVLGSHSVLPLADADLYLRLLRQMLLRLGSRLDRNFETLVHPNQKPKTPKPQLLCVNLLICLNIVCNFDNMIQYSHHFNNFAH